MLSANRRIHRIIVWAFLMTLTIAAKDFHLVEKHIMSATTQPVHSNRLADATSPYLLQHAHNPVDWYEWGPTALTAARNHDKPIFLSIGYAACHWCHVMAHESFENTETARTMNNLFINIKVDREERPDLDEIYMRATMVLNQGQGGWPMSVWLTPDGKPFFAGTYFPPTPRWGRPGFRQLCEKIGEAWKQHRTDIVAQADKLADVVRESLSTPAATHNPLNLATVDETAESLANAFDPQTGGMVSGPTNKFPPSLALDLILRSAHRRPTNSGRQRQLRQITDTTLEHMAYGGINDQIGGGFHRYSTDVEWHVPHFEKMLYDQALISRAYLDAFQFTKNPLYARIARETLDYVLRDLRAPTGGFYSSRDADTEGTEGKYYVWTKQQIIDVLGEECGQKYCACYDIRESGNWQDPHQPHEPKNIPRMLRTIEVCAKMYGITPDEVREGIANTREKLLAVREQRTPPALDDKILCEWNGLIIGSLARAGRILDQPRFITAAQQAADFLLNNLYSNGRLQRSYRHGQTTDVAFLSDYANLIEGLLELYQATFNKRWLDHARDLNHTAIQHFWDDHHGGFFFTPDDHENLLVRSKEVRDNATPSGNSVQLSNLLRLSMMLGLDEWRHMADRLMTVFADDVRQSPWAADRFLSAVDLAHANPLEIVIVGDPSHQATQALLKVIHSTYLPNHVLLLHNPAQPQQSINSPLLHQRNLVDGKPTAYVCQRGTCQQPVTTPDDLASLLSSLR